jgi:hypothetical protein
MTGDLISYLYLQSGIQYANLASNVANASMADLAQVMHRQQATIRELSVAVNVLTRMLVDGGVVDGDVLRTRVRAGIDEQIAQSNQTVCRECKQAVPLARTNITMTGPVCDSCAARAG